MAGKQQDHSNPRGPKQLGGWRKNALPSAEVRWQDIDAETLRNCIDAVTNGGAAIMLSRTSDGGAYAIMVLNGQEKLKEYTHDIPECLGVLRELIAFFEA